MSEAHCYFIGAGFSRAVNDAMPTLVQLQSNVLDQLRLPEETLDPYGNLEQWLSFLSVNQPWLSDSDNLRNRALFTDASQAVDECIKVMEGHTLRSPIPLWLERLISWWHESEATVISFNYDTLIERATSAQRRVFAWSDLYCLPITRRTSPGLYPAAGTPTKHLAELFKLHGSRNWAFSGLEAPPSDPILITEGSGGWQTDQQPNTAQRGPRAARFADLVPLIIPPTVTKGTFYSNRALRAQWREAANRISSAKTLTIIGYSFPESDIGTKHFLKTSLSADTPVSIVDYSEDSATRIQQMLGDTHNIQTYVGPTAVAEYVDSTCGDLVIWGAKNSPAGNHPFIEINGQPSAAPEACNDSQSYSWDEATSKAGIKVDELYPGLSAKGILYWHGGGPVNSYLAISDPGTNAGSARGS